MSNICIFLLLLFLLLLLLLQLTEKEETIVKSRYANKKYSQALTSPFDEVVVVKVTFFNYHCLLLQFVLDILTCLHTSYLPEHDSFCVTSLPS